MKFIYRLVAGLVAATMLLLAVPARSPAQSLSFDLSSLIDLLLYSAPPPLPQYYQPPAYQQNMIWQPGYWCWSQGGYFWVPGTWVYAPQPNLYWTPGYWGYNDRGYRWHPGYWSQNVGYYGGVNYGNGYYGSGYSGGRWKHNHFYYNTAVTNVNPTYVQYRYVDRAPLENRYRGNRVSYNGGRGGIVAQPTQQQIAVERQPHYAMTSVQQQHIEVAAQNRNFLATVNHGTPNVVAVPKPLAPTYHPTGFTPVKTTDRLPPATYHQVVAPVQHAAPVQQRPVAPVQQQPVAPVNHMQPQPTHQQPVAPVHPQTAAPVYPLQRQPVQMRTQPPQPVQVHTQPPAPVYQQTAKPVYHVEQQPVQMRTQPPAPAYHAQPVQMRTQPPAPVHPQTAATSHPQPSQKPEKVRPTPTPRP